MSLLGQSKQGLVLSNVLAPLLMALCNMLLVITAEVVCASQLSLVNYTGLLIVFVLGAILTAVWLDLSGQKQLSANARRFGLKICALILVPNLIGLGATGISGHAAALSLMYVQALGWGALLAVCHYLFFSFVDNSSKVPYYTLTLGAGHLSWAILAYFVPASIDLLGKSQLFLHLNIFRLLLAGLLAWAAWRLLHTSEVAPNSIQTAGAGDQNPPSFFRQWRKILYLSAPLLLGLGLSILLNTGVLLAMAESSSHSALRHLLMAVLCPLVALWLLDNEERLLTLLAVVIICFALSPILLLSVDSYPGLRPLVILLSSLVLYFLYLSGMLVLNRLFRTSHWPTLSLFVPWSLIFFLQPIMFLGGQLALHAPGVLALLIALGSLACLLCLPRLKRLPPIPESREAEQATAPGVEFEPDFLKPEPFPVRREIRDPGLQQLFCAAFQLTRREAEILNYSLRGMDVADVVNLLQISERTVRFHLTGILRKTGQTNRRRLANFFICWCERNSENGHALIEANDSENLSARSFK